jgi:hypothetical protein
VCKSRRRLRVHLPPSSCSARPASRHAARAPATPPPRAASSIAVPRRLDPPASLALTRQPPLVPGPAPAGPRRRSPRATNQQPPRAAPLHVEPSSGGTPLTLHSRRQHPPPPGARPNQATSQRTAAHPSASLGRAPSGHHQSLAPAVQFLFNNPLPRTRLHLQFTLHRTQLGQFRPPVQKRKFSKPFACFYSRRPLTAAPLQRPTINARPTASWSTCSPCTNRQRLLAIQRAHAASTAHIRPH